MMRGARSGATAAGCLLVVLHLAVLGLIPRTACGTPSSTVWTPMTMDIQAFRVAHIGIDNYFTVDRKAASGDAGAFPSDAGLTVGVLPGGKFQMEVGVDALNPSDAPYYLNAKFGAPEGSLFAGSPALQLGVFNVGLDHHATGQDIVYGVVGKTIPALGRLSAGPYAGNGRLLRDARGRKANQGCMVAFDRGFAGARDAAGREYNQWVFAADYASGRNAIGGGGAGISRYFTPGISVLIGPTWFNEKAINGVWKWTAQLDINM